MDKNFLDQVLLFIFLFLILLNIEPSFLYDENSGDLRPFGVGYTSDGVKKTLFNMSSMVIILSYISSQW